MKKTKEKDMTVKKLAGLMLKSFDTAQKHVNGRFGEVGKRFDAVDKKFDQVTEKINNISLNAVDVVRMKDFEELKDRVTDAEEVAELGRKKV